MVTTLRNYLLPLAISISLFAAPVDRLQTGDALPGLSGQTLSGNALTLPSAGAAFVLVFSFSHASAGDSRQWIDHSTAAGASGAYQAIELQSAPRLVRGMAVAGIKSATPASQRDHTILLYKDEAVWKARLGVTSDKYAYVLCVDKAGRIRWEGSGPFSESSFAGLKQSIADMTSAAR
jgi:hypothetical protein